MTSTLRRDPTIFKAVTGTGSSTAIWTPTTGKKFRVLRYALEITANASIGTGGVVSVSLTDGATQVGLLHSVFIPGTAGTGGPPIYTTGWVDLGSIGILSAAANNVLNLTLASSLTAGVCRVRVAGVEE